jgi:hypothetical protein
MSQRNAGILATLLMTLFASIVLPATVHAQDVGVVKVSKGTAAIERSGQQIAVPVGTKVREGDIISTGADGSVGVTFGDNSLLSIGPDSRLSIDRYAFDSTTHKGAFETSLNRGTLAAVSGKIAKQSPDAMKVRTPAAVLGVRGTEFVVRTGEPAGTTTGR